MTLARPIRTDIGLHQSKQTLVSINLNIHGAWPIRTDLTLSQLGEGVSCVSEKAYWTYVNCLVTISLKAIGRRAWGGIGKNGGLWTLAFLLILRELLQHLKNRHIAPEDISSMLIRFPSLRFPPPTPIPGRSCLVHAKQEGINEVLRATGVQHLLVPLYVLNDKIFHFLNHAVQAGVCARKVFQDAREDFKHLQGSRQGAEPIVFTGLVL